MVGLDLRVVLGAQKDGERGDIEPYQCRDGGSERAVDDAVVSETGYVPTKDQGSEEPDDSRHDGAGQDVAPVLAARRAEAIDDGKHDGGAEDGDGPARHTPQKEDIGLEAVGGDVDDPLLEEMAEGDQHSGERHGHQTAGNEHERSDAFAGFVPFGADTIEDGRREGAAEALHEGGHEAYAAKEGYQCCGAEGLQGADMA